MTSFLRLADEQYADFEGVVRVSSELRTRERPLLADQTRQHLGPGPRTIRGPGLLSSQAAFLDRDAERGMINCLTDVNAGPN